MSTPLYGRRMAGWSVLAVGVLASALARAQGVDANSAAPFGPPVMDDRVYAHGLLDQLEGRFGGGADAAFRWDGEAWAGTDANRIWLKSEGRVVGGQVEDGDHELLYAHPISTYFDLQTGVRYDVDALAGRGWAAAGVEGLAPYFFQLSVTLYASDAGHYAGKLVASREVLLTQRLILEPLVEINAYTRPDRARDVGAGFSDIDTGVRLRYEITRKFAPYLGAAYQYGSGSAPAAGGSPAATGQGGRWRLALGVRAWY